MSGQDYIQLTLYQGDSLASRFPSPGSAEARRTTVTSGLRCLELSKSCGLLGSLEKTLLGSSIWRSTLCYLTWKARVTPAGRLLFRLAPSAPRTDETDARLWPTVRAEEHGDYQYSKGHHDKPVPTLSGAVKLWPTPRASCRTGPLQAPARQGAEDLQTAVLWATPCAGDAHGAAGGQMTRSLRTDTHGAGGQLNPDWVECLMGFPPGWTLTDGPPQRGVSSTDGSLHGSDTGSKTERHV